MGRWASGERASYWRSMISRQRRSGLSIAAFCRSEGILPPSFYQWRRKLAADDAPETVPRLVPVPITPAAPADFEIRLPSGVSVVAPTGCDAAALRRLLSIVAQWEQDDA